LIYRLVVENLKHRPVRTFLSVIAIGVEVAMILTLVGLSHGMLQDLTRRSQGSGGDIFVRPPDSSLLSQSGKMPEGVVKKVRSIPHVTLATGTLIQPVSALEYITGINLDEFNALSGGFQYLEGGPLRQPDDILIDDVEARSKGLHAGDTIDLGRKWRVAGVVASGKLSRMFVDIRTLQHLYPPSGYISTIYVKADSAANIDPLFDALGQNLEAFKIYKMQELTSLYSVDNIPLLKPFTTVVIAIAAIVGFLMVFLSMYTAVLERTREIGILKALGASPGYILGALMRETVLLSIVGTLVGIALSFGTKWLMDTLAPTLPTAIVQDWWAIAGLIALGGAVIGAIYPGLKAARQDPIEALAYD